MDKTKQIRTVCIDSYIIKDFDHSPYFQKLVSLCSNHHDLKKVILVNSPNEQAIFNYLRQTGLKISSKNPKSCGDAVFIGRRPQSLHTKTDDDDKTGFEFKDLNVDTVFIIDTLGNYTAKDLEQVFKHAKKIYYLTTDIAFRKPIINEFNSEDFFIINIPLLVNPSNLANVSDILEEYTPFWNLLGANNLFKQTFYHPNSYLYYNPDPEKPLSLFNGETRDFTEINPEDIILTDAGDVSSKTMNSINTLKSEVNSKEQQSDLKVALEEIMKHSENLARNTIKAMRDYCIPIQERMEKLHAENDSLKELIQTRLAQPQVHDEIAEFYEELDDSDPLKAFRN
jgi:hypothetical protein